MMGAGGAYERDTPVSLASRILSCAHYFQEPATQTSSSLACEQAFSRAGWGEEKPSLSSLFFPKQRACSQASSSPTFGMDEGRSVIAEVAN